MSLFIVFEGISKSMFFQFYSYFCYIISFQCEKCNLTLIEGGAPINLQPAKRLAPQYSEPWPPIFYSNPSNAYAVLSFFSVGT